MRKIFTLTMSGLVTVLPLALTVYIIWWLVNTVEGWLRRVLIAVGVVSPEHYWPGLGLITGFENGALTADDQASSDIAPLAGMESHSHLEPPDENA